MATEFPARTHPQARKGSQVHRGLPEGNPDDLRSVWRQFTLLRLELANFGRRLVGMSNTKIAGVNSHERNIDEATPKERTAEYISTH